MFLKLINTLVKDLSKTSRTNTQHTMTRHYKRHQMSTTTPTGVVTHKTIYQSPYDRNERGDLVLTARPRPTPLHHPTLTNTFAGAKHGKTAHVSLRLGRKEEHAGAPTFLLLSKQQKPAPDARPNTTSYYALRPSPESGARKCLPTYVCTWPTLERFLRVLRCPSHQVCCSREHLRFG